MNNSNYISRNGIQLTEGMKVYRHDGNNAHSGTYLIECYEPVNKPISQGYTSNLIRLVHINGDKPNYPLATPDELFVKVR